MKAAAFVARMVVFLLLLGLALPAFSAPGRSKAAPKPVPPVKVTTSVKGSNAPVAAVTATNAPAATAVSAKEKLEAKAEKEKLDKAKAEKEKAEKALPPVNWSADLPLAQAKARAEGKSVLIHFTGSDWCGWCMKLRKDVFAKTEFEQYARSNLVLVAIDFPKRKLLPPMAQATNQRVAEQYQVQGFPTLILVAGNGERLGTVNYGHGGARTFVAEVEKLRNPPPEVPFEKARTPQTNTPRRSGRSKGERARKPEVDSYKRTSAPRR